MKYTWYSEERLLSLLARAAQIGIDLEKGSCLENITIAELDMMVSPKQ